MAKMVLTAEQLTVNATDLTALGVVKSAELTIDVEEKDVTNYASDGWKEVLGGLKSGSLKINFFQDYAAGAIDSIMWPLLGTVVAFLVRPTTAVIGASNPQYSGSILISGWSAVEGSVGDEATASVTYNTSGEVTRAVA